MANNKLPTSQALPLGSFHSVYYDPLGKEDELWDLLSELFEEIRREKDLHEVLVRIRGGDAPDLLIVVERKGYEQSYREIFKELSSKSRRLNILYLYTSPALYAREFVGYHPVFLPCEDPELFYSSLNSFAQGLMFKKGWMRYRIRVRELEEKIAQIGESYRKERRESEEKARMKEEWFASMVHELRTPVNGILGIAHLLEESDLRSEQQEHVRKIEHSGKVLLGVVNDLLDFAKLEHGMMEIEHIPFNLNEVLDQLASVIGIKAEEKELALIYDIDSNVPATLTGDPLRLSQVLINLLNNAVKFTEKGEIVLRISLKERKGEKEILLFEVSDTGAGMNAEQQKRLFRSFSQSDASVSRKYGGTGLGLTIAKNLVERMGGSIGVESHPGRGSRFYFTFPTERKERRSYRLPSRDLMFKKILIYDPSPNSAVATAKFFRYFHYGTALAHDERELKKVLRQERYDIVVLDESVDREAMKQCRELQPEARFGLLKSEYSGAEEKTETLNFSDILKRPLTQQKVFEFILNLYSAGSVKRRTKENLAALMTPYAGARIVIADDNPINQAVIMGLLSKAGLKGLLAGNGREVLKLLQSEKADLVLMDLNMPVMDGVEAAKKIREELGLRELPIVALSADRVGKEKVEKMQMQGSLAKPVDVKHFYSTLARLLTKREQSSTDLRQSVDAYLEESGFDVEKGLERAGGNATLYFQVAENFLRNAMESQKELQRKLQAGNLPEAIRLTNLIITGAENIHARRFQEMGTALYQVLQAKDASRAREHVQKLGASLLESIERVHEATLYKENMAKRKEGAPRGSEKLFTQKLEELEHAVRERRPYHCSRAIEALAACWWDVEHAGIIEKISHLFQEYQFDALEKYLHDQIGTI